MRARSARCKVLRGLHLPVPAALTAKSSASSDDSIRFEHDGRTADGPCLRSTSTTASRYRQDVLAVLRGPLCRAGGSPYLRGCR
jgi:hypothetical protein